MHEYRGLLKYRFFWGKLRYWSTVKRIQSSAWSSFFTFIVLVICCNTSCSVWERRGSLSYLKSFFCLYWSLTKAFLIGLLSAHGHAATYSIYILVQVRGRQTAVRFFLCLSQYVYDAKTFIRIVVIELILTQLLWFQNFICSIFDCKC